MYSEGKRKLEEESKPSELPEQTIQDAQATLSEEKAEGEKQQTQLDQLVALIKAIGEQKLANLKHQEKLAEAVEQLLKECKT